jgi:hypothetical protein
MLNVLEEKSAAAQSPTSPDMLKLCHAKLRSAVDQAKPAANDPAVDPNEIKAAKERLGPSPRHSICQRPFSAVRFTKHVISIAAQIPTPRTRRLSRTGPEAVSWEIREFA